MEAICMRSKSAQAHYILWRDSLVVSLVLATGVLATGHLLRDSIGQALWLVHPPFLSFKGSGFNSCQGQIFSISA